MAWFFQDFSGIDDVIRLYRDEHPNVSIEKEHVPSAEFTTKQAANFVAGTAADAMWGEGMQFPKFHDNNWTLDLTEHAKADKLNLRRDYALVGVELWCDKVRAMPMQVGPRAFYYNKTLLESVGAKDPWDDLKGEWTWEDMVTAAQKVARDTNGDGRNDQWGLQIPLTGLSEGYAMWAWTLGGAPADYKNMKFTFTSPTFREAAQFVHDLALRQKLIVTDDELTELRNAGVRDAFVGGKVAFFLRASPNVGTTLRDVGSSFRWDIAPFPKKDARRPGVALSSGNPNIIWSGTKAPDAGLLLAALPGGAGDAEPVRQDQDLHPGAQGRVEGVRDAHSRRAAAHRGLHGRVPAPLRDPLLPPQHRPLHRAVRHRDAGGAGGEQEPGRRPARRRAAGEPAGGLRPVPPLQGAGRADPADLTAPPAAGRGRGPMVGRGTEDGHGPAHPRAAPDGPAPAGRAGRLRGARAQALAMQALTCAAAFRRPVAAATLPLTMSVRVCVIRTLRSPT